MKSRRVEYNGDQEPTIVDLEDYEGEETEEQFESMDYDVQEVDGDGGEEYVAIIKSSEKDQNDLLVLSI